MNYSAISIALFSGNFTIFTHFFLTSSREGLVLKTVCIILQVTISHIPHFFIQLYFCEIFFNIGKIFLVTKFMASNISWFFAKYFPSIPNA